MNVSEYNAKNIVDYALQKLQPRTLGGVTKDSATDAVKAGVDEAFRQSEIRETELSKELDEYKNKTAREMADLTSQKDTVIIQTRQEAARKIADVQKRLKEAKATKVFEKQLDNGNTLIRKSNKNGTVGEVEINPKDVVVRYDVKQLDGSHRKTIFNPVTAKPVKTFDSVNHDVLMEYDANGKFASTKDVNVKKMKAEKPSLVLQTQPTYIRSSYSDEKGIQFERVYSDGTKDVIEVYKEKETNEVTRTYVRKLNSDGKLVSTILTNPESNYRRETLNNLETNAKTEIESYILNGHKHVGVTKDVFDEITQERVMVEKSHQEDDKKLVAKALKDEFGIYTGRYEYTFTDGKKPVKTEVGLKTDFSDKLNAFLK